MIGTRIFKIYLEIAEIFEVKVATRHLEIDILLLHRVKKIILVLGVATLTSIISAISKSIFKILVAIMKQISRAVEKRSEVPLYVLQNPGK